jgi:hypothetical protein
MSQDEDRDCDLVQRQGDAEPPTQRGPRRTLLRRAALVGVGITLAPLLAACGGEDDEEEDGEEQEQEQDEEEDQGGGDEPGEDV